MFLSVNIFAMCKILRCVAVSATAETEFEVLFVHNKLQENKEFMLNYA